MKRTHDIYTRRAAQILRRIQYATLATVCADGTPWNSPVYAIKDDELQLYWISDKQGQHSQNVRHNGQVFMVFYDSTVPEGEGEGVYIKASVRELESEDEIRRVRAIKKGVPDDPAQFLGDGVRRVYEALPEAVWMNDAEITDDGVFIRDYRVGLDLADLKRAFKLAE